MSNSIRMTTNYNTLDRKLNYLDVSDFHVVESKAKALTLAECLDYLCLDINDIPADELKLLTRCHRRGRLSAISEATSSLFTAMSNPRCGVQASIEYLKQFSDTFTIEASTNGSTTSGGFSFNVQLADDSASSQNPGSLKSVK